MVPGKRLTHGRSYVRQNVAVTDGYFPRSGERSYKALSNPG